MFFLSVSCCVPCTFHVRRKHTLVPWQRRLMHLWTKRPRRAMSHHLNASWFVQGTTILENEKNIWNRSIFRWAWYSIISWEVVLHTTSIPGCVSWCENFKADIRCFFGHLEFYCAGSSSLTKWPQNIPGQQGLSLQKIYPSHTVPTNSLNSQKLMNHTGPLAMFWQIYKTSTYSWEINT